MLNEENSFPERWVSSDDKILTLEGEVKPKIGGARTVGKYTGVYNFGDETMLVKQGDSIGETVAEYVGGNLYQLTIPDYAAKSYLVRPENSHSKKEVYVTSVFSKKEEGVAQDAFKVVGHEKKPAFVRFKHAIKKRFSSKKESLIRKWVKDDEENANSTLGYPIANALWHGDHDVHMGNFIKLSNDENPSKNKYMKIDHGFSFFNFKKKASNIFNPFAGKKFSISLSRALKGEKLIEIYSFNYFWDLAAEKKRFYYSGSFIKGCDDIVHLKEEEIRENIEKSLKNVQQIYGKDADKALRAFAKRMRMSSRDFKHKSGDELVNALTKHITETLMYRQKSLAQLAQHCREEASKLTEGHHKISRVIDDYIINLLDKKTQIEAFGSKKSLTKEEIEQFRTLPYLDNRIEFYKMLSQANDLNYLTISSEGEIILKTEFYFYNSGKSKEITLHEFKDKIEGLSKEDKGILKVIAEGMKHSNSSQKGMLFSRKRSEAPAPPPRRPSRHPPRR